MRGTRAKGIKKGIVLAIYGADVLKNDKDMKKERRKIFADRRFEKIYKAAKKNWKRKKFVTN